MRSVPLPPQGAPVKKQNLAARAGRWSAQHRKKAIFGWFAFVIVATLIGGNLGHQDDPLRRGGPGRRLRPRPGDRQGHLPAGGRRAGLHPVQDPGLAERRLPRRRQGRRAAARRRQGRLEHPVPLRQGERRADLARRPLRRRDVRDQGRLDAGRGQGRPGPRRHRRGAEGPSRAAHRAVRRRQHRQGRLEDVRGRPQEGRDDLAADHAGHPAARVRRARRRRPAAAARRHRRDGDHGPRRRRQPVLARDARTCPRSSCSSASPSASTTRCSTSAASARSAARGATPRRRSPPPRRRRAAPC